MCNNMDNKQKDLSNNSQEDSMDLLLTINHWKKNHFPEENVIESLKECPLEISRAISAIQCTIINLPDLIVPLPKKEFHSLFENHSAFILSHWEGNSLLIKSFLFGLTGSYNTAFSLLRNAFECFCKGVFMNHIARNIDNASTIISNKIKNDRFFNSLKKIFDYYQNNPIEFDGIEKNTVMIYDRFDDIDVNLNLHLGKIVTQLQEWNYFYPIEHPMKLIEYGRLCDSIHQTHDCSDIARRIEEYDLFEDPTPVISNSLKEYIEILCNVSDCCNVISINLMKKNILQSSLINHNLIEFYNKRQFQNAKLIYSKQLIEDIGI